MGNGFFSRPLCASLLWGVAVTILRQLSFFFYNVQFTQIGEKQTNTDISL